MKEQRSQTKGWMLALGLSLSLMASQAMGEGSGLAQQTTSSIVNNSTPQNNSGDGNNSREFNLGDAAAQSGTGSNTAALTGMALVSAAIPMLASPLIPVKIAGATLMGEAGLEFAQAGADKGTQNQNSQGQQTLNNSGGDAAASPSGNTDSGNGDLASQLQQMLGSQNVPNAQGLSQALANGALTNPSDVLQAMGDNTNYSAQDLAQGASIAQQQAQSTMASNTNSSSTTSVPSAINYNPGAQNVAGGGGGGAGGMGGSSNKSDAGGSSQNPLSDSALSSSLASAAAGNLTPAQIDQMQGTLAKQSGFLGSAFLTNLLGNQGAADVAHRTAANIASLRARGIQKAIPGQNIFQLARHNYHSFDVWRKTAFLARN